MKIVVAAATLALLTAPAFAQSSSTSGPQANQNTQSNGQQANQNTQSNSHSAQQSLVAAQKIKQDLQREGFTDVKVVAESFVVQGKSPDGNPVVMTIGPQGMSVFEAMNGSGSKSGTVGSTNGSPSNSGSNSSQPNSGAQQR
jgi:hypothetical protein